MKFFISAVIGALFPFCPAAYAGLDIKGVRVDVAPDCVHITSIETRIGTFGDVCTPRRPRIYRKVSFLDQPADMEIYFGAEGLVKAVSVLVFISTEDSPHFQQSLVKPQWRRALSGTLLELSFNSR